MILESETMPELPAPGDVAGKRMVRRFDFTPRRARGGGVKDYPDEWVCGTCAWSKGSKKTLGPIRKGQKTIWCCAAERWVYFGSDRACYEEPLEMLEKRKAYEAKVRARVVAPNEQAH